MALVAVRGRAQVVVQDVGNFVTDTYGYNLVSLGNVTLSGSSTIQGGIAVGGTLAIGGNWTIAGQVGAGSNPSLYAAGNMTLNGTTQVNNGFAATPGLTGSWTWNGTAETLTGSSGALHFNSGTQTNPRTASAPFTFSTEKSNVTAISSSLAGVAATGTISVVSQNLSFTTGATSGVVVFDLDASSLSGNSYQGSNFSGIQVNVPSGVTYVINVINLASSATLFGSGSNFNSGNNNNQLLWNFTETGNLTIGANGNFYGSILAPNENLTAGSTINGQVVAGSFVDNGTQLNDTSFAPTATLVPEPPAFALGALALCGAAIAGGAYFSRRRARAAAAG